MDTWQFTLHWPSVAPTRPARPQDPSDPAYRWPAGLDAAVGEAGAHGVNVALLAIYSPRWANGGRPPVWAPSTVAYSDFLVAAARRYPAVRRWMIWSEPNKGDRLQPNSPTGPTGARTYAPLLEAAYSSLKAVSPRNIVIGGMTWTGGEVKPKPFLDGMRLPNGHRPRLDWFGHNPFPFRFPNIREEAIGEGYRDISDLDLFSREVRQAYPRTKPRLWLSEFTVQSDKPSRDFALVVSRAEQARWLTASYRIADELPSVAGLGWLGLLDEREAPGSANFGLLTAGGARKPSFYAFRKAPSRRLRPSVRAPRRVSRRTVRRRGVRVRVRPKVSGRVRVVLRSRRGRSLRRSTRRLRVRRTATVRLRRARLRRGRYTVVVLAPRGERVERSLRVR
ncbi:MAG: hypothetical protein M3433_06800 [Actinomycetota bacterium]|nr:hypothetical protein [Actinomycetota bacterium]